MTTSLSNFDKRWSDAHFVSFIFYYYCSTSSILHERCILHSVKRNQEVYLKYVAENFFKHIIYLLVSKAQECLTCQLNLKNKNAISKRCWNSWFLSQKTFFTWHHFQFNLTAVSNFNKVVGICQNANSLIS